MHQIRGRVLVGRHCSKRVKPTALRNSDSIGDSGLMGQEKEQATEQGGCKYMNL